MSWNQVWRPGNLISQEPAAQNKPDTEASFWLYTRDFLQMAFCIPGNTAINANTVFQRFPKTKTESPCVWSWSGKTLCPATVTRRVWVPVRGLHSVNMFHFSLMHPWMQWTQLSLLYSTSKEDFHTLHLMERTGGEDIYIFAFRSQNPLQSCYSLKSVWWLWILSECFVIWLIATDSQEIYNEFPQDVHDNCIPIHKMVAFTADRATACVLVL